MKRGMTLWRYFTDSQEHAGGFIMVKAVVGANWGDEGKGKITDMLAEKADIIIRFQGGANAGHTIINDYGKFALHTLPSGVFYGHTTSIIGNGVAVDIPVLFRCSAASSFIPPQISSYILAIRSGVSTSPSLSGSSPIPSSKSRIACSTFL